MASPGYANCEHCEWDFIVTDEKFGDMSKDTLAKMLEVLHVAEKHPIKYAEITHRDPDRLKQDNPDVYRALKRYL